MGLKLLVSFGVFLSLYVFVSCLHFLVAIIKDFIKFKSSQEIVFHCVKIAEIQIEYLIKQHKSLKSSSVVNSS